MSEMSAPQGAYFNGVCHLRHQNVRGVSFSCPPAECLVISLPGAKKNKRNAFWNAFLLASWLGVSHIGWSPYLEPKKRQIMFPGNNFGLFLGWEINLTKIESLGGILVHFLSWSRKWRKSMSGISAPQGAYFNAVCHLRHQNLEGILFSWSPAECLVIS